LKYNLTWLHGSYYL